MEEYLQKIEQIIAQGPFKNNWDSLGNYQPPSWYQETKFGIFIHWGIYSVPAFSCEWYSRNMYIQGSKEFKHHIETYGPHKEFGYKDFIPLFKAEHFDPEKWADLIQQAGAQYVVPVAEHHDGFQMYKSELSHWNAYEMGPERDILGELSNSFQKRGIHLGASSHRAEHWFFMGHGKEFDSDIKEPMERGDFYWPAMPEAEHYDLFSKPFPSKEYLEDWLIRTCELVDQYKPRIVYFDWWIHHEAFKPYLKKFAAYYYNRAAQWGEGVVINYKHDSFMFGSAVVDIERGQFADAKPYLWQTDTAVAYNSWCYTEGNNYKKAADLICDLVDIVSKNGRLLLNIGPKADGTIPKEDEQILLEIGEWLKTNGEAIYGTKLWRESEEGPTRILEGQFSEQEVKNYTSQDIRYTVKGKYLYAIPLRCATDGVYKLTCLQEKKTSTGLSFYGIIRNVEVLGFEQKPSYQRDEESLEIRLPGVFSEKPIVFKIEID